MPSAARSQNGRQAQDLSDRLAVNDILIRLTRAIDSRDWIAYRSCFSDSIEIDYRSLIGGDLLSVTGDAWSEQARRSFAGFETTQHFISNQVCELDGDRASASAYIRAEHFVSAGGTQEFWTLGGVYDADLSRTASGEWCIEKLKLDVRWSRGNPDIFELAAQDSHSTDGA